MSLNVSLSLFLAWTVRASHDPTEQILYMYIKINVSIWSSDTNLMPFHARPNGGELELSHGISWVRIIQIKRNSAYGVTPITIQKTSVWDFCLHKLTKNFSCIKIVDNIVIFFILRDRSFGRPSEHCWIGIFKPLLAWHGAGHQHSQSSDFAYKKYMHFFRALHRSPLGQQATNIVGLLSVWRFFDISSHDSLLLRFVDLRSEFSES